MADKDTIWTAVKAAYAVDTLIPLTNIEDRSVNAIDDAVGTAAADQAINLWKLDAEVTFDVLDLTHMAVAIRATVAVLYERGGVSAEVGREEWNEVYGEEGLMAKLRRTGSRGRTNPATSGPDLNSDNEPLHPYSHVKAMPVGFMPSTRTVSSDDD